MEDSEVCWWVAKIYRLFYLLEYSEKLEPMYFLTVEKIGCSLSKNGMLAVFIEDSCSDTVIKLTATLIFNYIVSLGKR